MGTEPIKYIVSDFDGTLTINGQLSHTVIKRIEELKKKNYSVIIVTGRPLSWCNMMINSFPLDAVVGENGGGYYYRDDNGIKFTMMTDINLNYLYEFRNTLQNKFPELIMSDDNMYRVCDTAIVLDTNYYKHEKELLEFLGHNNMSFKISNIHINIWKDKYDKLSATTHLFNNFYGQTDFGNCVYFGDSPNDEPMFSKISLSVGVGNIRRFLPMMIHHPSHITEQSEGHGFIEFTDRLIKE